MKKGLMLLAAFMVTAAAQAQQTKTGTGSIGAGLQTQENSIPATKPIASEKKNGVKYAPLPIITKDNKLQIWKVSQIKPLNNNADQLKNIFGGLMQSIKRANNLNTLQTALNDAASKLQDLKTTKQAKQYLMVLSEDLKNLVSQNNNDVIIASKNLHKHVTMLPTALQSEGLTDLSNVFQNLKKTYLQTVNKIAAMKLKEAQEKTGKARDDAIIGGLLPYPIHVDMETLEEMKKALTLKGQLLKLQSADGKKELMDLQTKAIELDSAE